MAAAAGLSTRPQWNIPIKPRLAEGVRLTTRLLMDRPAHERPDALILMDDHLVEAATQGIHEAGIDANADLTVIGYCNFPARPRSLVPIIRLGFDCRQLLASMIEAIDAQRQGRPVPAMQRLSPILEEELAAAHPQ